MPKSLDLDSLARRRPLSQALESWPLSQTPSHHHSSRPSSRSDQPSSTPTSASHHPPSPNPSAYSLNLSPATFPSDRLGAQAISPIITCHFGERVCVWGGVSSVQLPWSLRAPCPGYLLSPLPVSACLLVSFPGPLLWRPLTCSADFPGPDAMALATLRDGRLLAKALLSAGSRGGRPGGVGADRAQESPAQRPLQRRDPARSISLALWL